MHTDDGGAEEKLTRGGVSPLRADSELREHVEIRSFPARHREDGDGGIFRERSARAQAGFVKFVSTRTTGEGGERRKRKEKGLKKKNKRRDK